MALAWIDIVLIVAFLLLSLFIAWWFKGRAGRGLEDFFLGGRNLPWYLAGLSMVATTFAADTPLAVSEMVARNGISRNWLWWCFLSGGMLTTFFFADLWRRSGVLTELEFIHIRYSGPAARFLRRFKALYLGLFMNCMILAWVNLALASLLEVFLGISGDQLYMWVFGGMLLAAFYSSLSGLLGIVVTDAIQFFIALLGTTVLAVLVVNSPEIGGIEGLKAGLPDEYFHFMPAVGGDGEKNGMSTFTLSIGAFLSYIGIQWWASWYPGSEPGGGGYIAQRMMSTKNEKDSVLATLFFQVVHFCVRPWPWIIVALCAVSLYGAKYNMDDELREEVMTLKAAGVEESELTERIPGLEKKMEADPHLRKVIGQTYNKREGYVYAMQDHLPAGLRGLLLVAFIAAYLSTVSTQLNWGASYLVNDLYLPLIRGPDRDPEKGGDQGRWNVLAGRVATFLIMLLAILVTTLMESIHQTWEFILDWGAGVGAVLILRWYWWRINAWSEFSATLAPFIGYGLGKWYLEPVLGEGFVQQNGTFIVTVGLTTVVWLLVTYFTRPTDMGVLRNFYERVRPDGHWVPVQKALGLSGQGYGNLLRLGLCWISSVILLYAILFLIGKTILYEWQEAFISGVVALVSLAILRQALKKTRIFGHFQ